MTDLTGPLQVAMGAALKTDSNLLSIFGGLVKVYDIPPVNARPPYIVIGQDDLIPVQADGFDLSEIDATAHVWSLTDPHGLSEAKEIGAAAGAVFVALSPSTGLRIYATDLQRARYLIDADGETAHGIITTRFTVAPA